MKHTRIEYHPSYRRSPLSPWVHRPLDGESWHDASEFEPPLPRPVPDRGYATLVVEWADVELRFASIPELEHFIAVLGRKNLPTSLQLCEGRGFGPNSHWLARLPAKLLPWSKRERLVPFLRRALDEFSKV